MLKLIALITMLIDHIGASLFPSAFVMRFIGRISFPIFAFGLAEGYIYTKSKEKYFKRLLVFSFVSFIPYILLFGGYIDIKSFAYVIYLKPISAIQGKLNIGFTFCLAFLSLMCIDRIRANKKDIKGYIGIIVILLITNYVGVDYGIYGVLVVMTFYIFRDNYKIIFLAFCLIPFSLIGAYDLSVFICQYIAILALPIIFFLKDKDINKNIKIPKWLSYTFYPLHITILWLLRVL